MMTRRELIELCLTLGNAYEDYPFDLLTDTPGAWTVVRHKDGKKGFAHIFERSGLCINLKCNPFEADMLRQAFADITPAYHMNKQHWNTVKPDGDVPPEILHGLIENSYNLTKKK